MCSKLECSLRPVQCIIPLPVAFSSFVCVNLHGSIQCGDGDSIVGDDKDIIANYCWMLSGCSGLVKDM